MATKENTSHDKETPKFGQAEILEGLSDAAKVAEEALQKGMKQSKSFIKKHPLETALLAFGVGVIAGLFINKNRE